MCIVSQSILVPVVYLDKIKKTTKKANSKFQTKKNENLNNPIRLKV